MTHYEERLERDLAAIRERIVTVASAVEDALRDSVAALLGHDRSLAADVVVGDLAINRAIREIDRKCHAFIVRHLPSAGHLRFVSSVLRLNVEIERVGDYAVAICREALQLTAAPPEGVGRDIELIADETRYMLHQALKSFHEADPELARNAKAMSSQVEATFEKVFADLIDEGEKGSRPIRDLFALLVIFNRLGRVSDQAKNICEETLFAASGEIKAPKVYRVLFIDEKNSCQSQMAEAIARKAFPESGRYESAGWDPATALEDRFVQFMDRQGHSLGGAAPTALSAVQKDLHDYHAIVSLEGSIKSHLSEIPFQTIPLEWEVGVVSDGLDDQRTEELYREIYRQVAARVETLMVALRGEDAG
jgi:phosphate transport system protein